MIEALGNIRNGCYYCNIGFTMQQETTHRKPKPRAMEDSVINIVQSEFLTTANTRGFTYQFRSPFFIPGIR